MVKVTTPPLGGAVGFETKERRDQVTTNKEIDEGMGGANLPGCACAFSRSRKAKNNYWESGRQKVAASKCSWENVIISITQFTADKR